MDMRIGVKEEPWILFLIVRLMSALLVQTWFVADEYWQATEIAHRMAFGYGYETWEWRNGLRSAVYPALFGGTYKILEIIKLDYPVVLIELPRVLHAVAFSIGDSYVWRLSETIYGRVSAYWTAICLISSWFLEYCAPRTLTSCAEAILSSVALCHYPWKKRKDCHDTGYVWLMGAACVIRPTAAILFLPLCLKHLQISQKKAKLIFNYTFIIAAVLSLSVVIDSWYYGNWVVVPWRFAHFNAVSGLSSHYGTHPWHWYLTQGIPVTLATHLVPFLLAVFYHPRRHKELLLLCAWFIFVYSCLGHKEFRFLLPVLPLFFCIAGDYIAVTLSSQSKKVDISITHRSVMIKIILILPNFLVIVYLGLVHQRGPMDVMHTLRGDISGVKNPDILYLMPCHSTPFYSHLHRNVSMRFLTCEPNLHYKVEYMDEADIFEDNPIAWLEQEYGLKEEYQGNGEVLSKGKESVIPIKKPLPTHILLFDVLFEKIESFLSINYYRCSKIFNSHVTDGRRSKFIFVYCRW